MPRARVNGIEIEYETFGDPTGRPLLLISGLGDQLIHWGEDFCADLAGRGHRVIRFDNRDAGLSTQWDADPAATGEGSAMAVPYSLADMADDTAGLLEVLETGSAHICGASMGGMIAQLVALRYPSRVRSLILIYTHGGSRILAPPRPEVVELLFRPAPSERDGYVDYMVSLFRAMAGTGRPFDEEWARKLAARAWDRSYSPKGTARQVKAISSQESREKELPSIKAPTLVVHGTDDPLLPVEAAVELADAIPGAELLLIEGMGHEHLHGTIGAQIAEAIAHHTSRAESPYC